MVPWPKARSLLANAVQSGASPERIEALRRDYRAARAAHYLRDLVSAEPPLTTEQRAELARVLAGGDGIAAA